MSPGEWQITLVYSMTCWRPKERPISQVERSYKLSISYLVKKDTTMPEMIGRISSSGSTPETP